MIYCLNKEVKLHDLTARGIFLFTVSFSETVVTDFRGAESRLNLINGGETSESVYNSNAIGTSMLTLSHCHHECSSQTAHFAKQVHRKFLKVLALGTNEKLSSYLADPNKPTRDLIS